VPKVRLQRYLSQAGLASRRRCEQLVLDGRVSVNGHVVRELGVRVDPARDEVSLDGNRVQLEDRTWLVLNKPAGAITTLSDPEGRQTVIDLIGNQGVRLYPVGRLDFATEGVLLLTNDGELANALMHPSHQVPRIYEVKLKGIADPDDLEKLRQGVELDGQKVSAERLHVLKTTDKNTWVELTLRQGMNHQVHRMFEAIGGTVLRLIRVSYAGITVHGLRPGAYRSLTQAEVDELRSEAGLKRETVRTQAVQPGRRSRGTLDRPRREAGRNRDRATRAPHARKPGTVERAPRERRARDDERAPRPRRERDEQRAPRPRRERDEQRAPRQKRERDEQRAPRQKRERDEQRAPRQKRGRDEQRAPRQKRERDEQRAPRQKRERDEQRAPRQKRERDEQRAPRQKREGDDRPPRERRQREERPERKKKRWPAASSGGAKKPWWPTKKKPPVKPDDSED
jgi:23S rRNA pseudouridine2605 synthase